MGNDYEVDAAAMARALVSGVGTQRLIAQQGVKLVALLLRKNADYGDSAMMPPMLCPHMEAGDAILCRLSDKIRRLENLLAGDPAKVAESIIDTMTDIPGYAILWLVEQEKERLDVPAPY